MCLVNSSRVDKLYLSGRRHPLFEIHVNEAGILYIRDRLICQISQLK